MPLYWVLVVGACLMAEVLSAQSFKDFQKMWQKGFFQKTKKILEKTLAKDSSHLTALHLYSLYYLQTKNREYNVDKAHHFALKLLSAHGRIGVKKQRKYAKKGISLQTIVSLIEKIDSLAFQQAFEKHTESAFQDFIHDYPTARQRQRAVFLRDSIAFAKAQEENTHVAYKKFLEKYPDAIQAPLAQQRYETLLYEFETQQGTIDDYERFIQQYPHSPFRAEAETKLYYMFTADNQQETLASFLEKFPDNRHAEHAWWRLWYLTENKAFFLEKYPYAPIFQEAKQLYELDTVDFIAFVQNERFGFIDKQGNIRISPIFSAVSEDYLCSTLETDYIIAIRNDSTCIYNKAGKQLVCSQFEDVYPFGNQAIKVMKNGKFGLLHKAGFELLDCKYEKLEFIDNHIIQAQYQGRWGIIGYLNDVIVPFELEKIIVEREGAIILKKQKWAIAHSHMLLNGLKNKNLQLLYVYDTVESFGSESHVKVYQNGKVNLFDFIKAEEVNFFPRTPEGQTRVFLYETLKEVPFGWVAQNQSNYALHFLNGNYLENLSAVIPGTSVCAIQQNEKWGIVSQYGDIVVSCLYDSVVFLGEDAFLLFQGNKKWGYFLHSNLVDLSSYKWFTVQSLRNIGEQTRYFIIIEDKNGKKGLLSSRGEMILKPKYDEIYCISDTLFRVSKASKKGLIGLQTQLLPLQFDGIIYDSRNQTFVLLATQKFGLYHLPSKKLIKPEYDVMLRHYQDTIWIAKKEKYGFVSISGNALTPFEFDDIQFWNDTSALVFYKGKWRIYAFKYALLLDETFDTYKLLCENENEKVILTYRSSGYGLLSNQKNRILPEAYSQIYNIGSLKRPFYVAESHIQKAELYVVLFVNEAGEVVKKDVLKAEDYELFACNN
ncbi:MAG: WG repeat-containing protein [Cytophagales bacterium]|nr:WG repeat-containing protein [Cytophagales bacterium]MDW8384046.1 WG repeat-containing protein [Flammeovirgaceae bacterium]